MGNILLNSTKQRTKYWWASLFIGILAIVVGVWCLTTPDITLAALTKLFVVAFFISGIIDILYALFNIKSSNSWGWTLVGGIIDIIVGTLLLTLPLSEISSLLVYFVAFWILFRSIWTIGTAVDLQKSGVSGWVWLLVIAIVGILYAFFLILSPMFYGTFVVTFISISFIVYGIFRVYYSFKLKSMSEKLKN